MQIVKSLLFENEIINMRSNSITFTAKVFKNHLLIFQLNQYLGKSSKIVIQNKFKIGQMKSADNSHHRKNQTIWFRVVRSSIYTSSP